MRFIAVGYFCEQAIFDASPRPLKHSYPSVFGCYESRVFSKAN